MAEGLWSRDKLQKLAKQRLSQRAKLQPVEQAALAFARWQGMTDEADVNLDAAKAELDRLTDAMDPKQWEPLKDLVGAIDDQVLRGLMAYSIQRSADQLREQAVELTAQSESMPPADPPAKRAKKTKKRDKSR